MLLVVDNHDSFTFNLVQYAQVAGAGTRVLRASDPALLTLNPADFSGLLVSPGPRGPLEAGHSLAVLERWLGAVPILGVCLGHQCLVQLLGGHIERAPAPRHGKSSLVRHDGQGLFAGLPSPLRVGRYHSLVAAPASLPSCLQVSAVALDDGAVMGVRHESLPAFGVQFHPESVLTEHGQALMSRFVALLGPAAIRAS